MTPEQRADAIISKFEAEALGLHRERRAIADAIRAAENAAYELCAARIEDCPDFIAGVPIARGIRRLIRSAPAPATPPR